MSPIAPPIGRIWACYNHLPGGQIVAIHFEEIIRQKKVGDGTQEVVFTAREQLEGFRKSDFVALNVGGKIVKNQVLEYRGGQDLSRNPRAPDVVIAWAKSQGLDPIFPPPKAGEPVIPSQTENRVAKLENDVAELKSGQKEILDLLRKK